MVRAYLLLQAYVVHNVVYEGRSERGGDILHYFLSLSLDKSERLLLLSLDLGVLLMAC